LHYFLIESSPQQNKRKRKVGEGENQQLIFVPSSKDMLLFDVGVVSGI
jgi:hypothetical protein